MAKNILSNENQRPPTKTTLTSMALYQDRKPNKKCPRHKKSKRIHFQQTNSATDAKGTVLKKEKRVRKRGTQVRKNGSE